MSDCGEHIGAMHDAGIDMKFEIFLKLLLDIRE